MTTITITKKTDCPNNVTLEAATDRMSWGEHYEYAFDQGTSASLLQKGFPASMEYILEDGDEIVEVDANNQEIDRCAYED